MVIICYRHNSSFKNPRSLYYNSPIQIFQRTYITFYLCNILSFKHDTSSTTESMKSYSPKRKAAYTTLWICFRVLFLWVLIKPGSLPRQPVIRLRQYFLLWYTMHLPSFLVAQGIITFLGGTGCNNLPLTWKECASMPKNNKCIKISLMLKAPEYL